MAGDANDFILIINVVIVCCAKKDSVEAIDVAILLLLYLENMVVRLFTQSNYRVGKKSGPLGALGLRLRFLALRASIHPSHLQLHGYTPSARSKNQF